MPEAPPFQKTVAAWLFFTSGLIFIMALVGAITRLTESGLSIVEWRPVTGFLPPLNEADWQQVFDLYKQSPQFQKTNPDMTLDAFKGIFFWEWFHRLLGRVIGLVYALPWTWFLARKKIPAGRRLLLAGIFLLGAAQGGMGWYMVKSGLIDIPAVSHYRLAAHLGLAFLLFALTFRAGLGFALSPSGYAFRLRRMRWMVRLSLLLFTLTFIWGAFVAGLDAGLIYNSFPMMGGTLVPEDMWAVDPLWLNFFENHAAVQFTHRWLALGTGAMILLTFARSFSTPMPPRLVRLFLALGGTVLIQVGLGIATLLSQVNIVLAVLHQGGAMILLAVLVWILFEMPPRKNVKAVDI